jgi:hypothetical protein
MQAIQEPHQNNRRKVMLSIRSSIVFVCASLLLVLPSQSFAFTDSAAFAPRRKALGSPSKLHVVPQVAASLLAGSVSGAIGIGVAYPLDTLKTKTQVMAEAAKKSGKATGPTPNMLETMRYIYENDGVQGFFGGVRAMMVGQAFIKAVAFCVNDSAITYLERTQGNHVDELTIFIAAACFSGFVTSFVTAPAERIKIIMQANGKDLYENDWDCFTTVLRNEGVRGLFSRGLGTTLLRDTPSYGLYFAVYHVLMSQTEMVHILGDILAPMSFGAFSGCLSWIPIYPIDVVKVSYPNLPAINPASSSTVYLTKNNLLWYVFATRLSSRILMDPPKLQAPLSKWLNNCTKTEELVPSLTALHPRSFAPAFAIQSTSTCMMS